MKRFNEPAVEYPVRLDNMAGSEGWGTAKGAQIFAKLNVRLLRLPERTLVVLDLGGLARADVSFLREAVVETLRKHRPRLLFIATGLVNADVQANLESALMLQGECLLLRRGKGVPAVLGKKLPKE